MSTVQAALEDINWLSKRLKGLITLSEEIKTYDTMKTQTEEFKAQLSDQKNKFADIVKKIKDKEVFLSNLSDEHQSAIENYNTQADAIIAKAKVDAEEIRKKAEKEAQTLRASSQEDKTSMDREISVQIDRLNSLKKEVINTSNTLASLQKQISDLKAKF